LALLSAGCQQDEITSYTVPKDPAEQQEAGPDKVAMLAAFFPQGDAAWSFKLMGPVEVVPEHKKDFAKFVNSVRLTGKNDDPFKWTVPEGWKFEKGNAVRYGTFRFGPPDNPLELTIIKTQGEKAADVFDNVNRWREQVGLRKVGLAEIARTVHQE